MEALGIDTLFKGSNALRLLDGLCKALEISLVSVILSIALGIILGVIMTFKNPVVKVLCRIYLEIVRIMPQMVLLFIVFFGTTKVFRINIEAELASIIVFTFWGTAEMGDLVRGSLQSIPKHQYESAFALGMTQSQTYASIIIPQTLRRLIPLSINLITRMIKTTSLVMMIGVVEVLKVGQQIIEANRMTSPNAAFGIYLTIFILYFLACWPISLLAGYLEKKWSN
ncbi:MAG: amino acid ABC transporter permease [Ruminococcus sp.]